MMEDGAQRRRVEPLADGVMNNPMSKVVL